MITRLQCRAARAIADVTQEQLAEASGVGIVTIRQFELGRTSPRASTLRAIANALKRKGVILLDGSSPGVRMRAPPARVGIAEAQTNLMLQ
jgi:transcriptional regulator with XRE-family HTH domain